MGLFLVYIIVISLITFLAYIAAEKRDERIDHAVVGFVIPVLFFMVVSGLVVGKSYQTYIGLNRSAAVIEQYQTSIKMYAAKGIKEFEPGIEITDLKYNNYQTQMGIMIRDLRNIIVKYNSTLAGKRILNDSVMFNWFIILPDDMKFIKMAE